MKLAGFVLLTLYSLAMSPGVARGQAIQVSKDNRTIAITATESAEADADLADVSVGFRAFGVEQNQTYADAAKTSNRIIDALLHAGIKKEQIKSSEQGMTQIESGDKRYAQGQRFKFSQTWTVMTKATDAAEALNVAVQAGANNSGNIAWRLAKDDVLEAQAAQKALEHARQIAEHMAAGLHASLGALIYASNEAPEHGLPGGVLGVMGGVLASPPPPPVPKLAILPDKVTRSATVYAVFAIQ